MGGQSIFQGLNEFFKFLESNSYKIQFRVMLSRIEVKQYVTLVMEVG